MARKAQVQEAKRVIGYVRVSTDKQAEHGVSLDAQQEKLRQYAALYDLEIVEIVVDDGASAKDLDRPNLPRVLDALRDGVADAILVTKLDRLTRSVKDLGDLLERSNREGWSIRSVGEQLDTASAAGRLVVNILGAVSQWEREAIGERTAAALSHKKSKGEYCGGKVPFGFRVEDGMLVKDEQQAAAAVRIRQLHASGVSLRKIADALTTEGYPHPCGRWNHSTVARCIAAE
jgi:DNA invertase Pin-like site-specific DNA recombinase